MSSNRKQRRCVRCGISWSLLLPNDKLLITTQSRTPLGPANGNRNREPVLTLLNDSRHQTREALTTRPTPDSNKHFYRQPRKSAKLLLSLGRTNSSLLHNFLPPSHDFSRNKAILHDSEPGSFVRSTFSIASPRADCRSSGSLAIVSDFALRPLPLTPSLLPFPSDNRNRLARTTGAFQVNGCIVKFHTILHRPLPSGAYLKVAALIGKRIIQEGYHWNGVGGQPTPARWNWSLQLTLEVPPQPLPTRCPRQRNGSPPGSL